MGFAVIGATIPWLGALSVCLLGAALPSLAVPTGAWLDCSDEHSLAAPEQQIEPPLLGYVEYFIIDYDMIILPKNMLLCI
jgi:hypothetical protein